MKTKTLFSAVVVSAIIFLLSVTGFAQMAKDTRRQESRLRAQITEMLAAYSRKDSAALMNIIDGKQILVMGTDVSEVADSKSKVKELFENDFRLWETSAFGEIKNFYADFDGKAAIAFFDAPWESKSGGVSRKFIIRFATSWREQGGEWKLTKLLNAVPTVGQSAGEILRGQNAQ